MVQGLRLYTESKYYLMLTAYLFSELIIIGM